MKIIPRKLFHLLIYGWLILFRKDFTGGKILLPIYYYYILGNTFFELIPELNVEIQVGAYLLNRSAYVKSPLPALMATRSLKGFNPRKNGASRPCCPDMASIGLVFWYKMLLEGHWVMTFFCFSIGRWGPRRPPPPLFTEALTRVRRPRWPMSISGLDSCLVYYALVEVGKTFSNFFFYFWSLFLFCKDDDNGK